MSTQITAAFVQQYKNALLVLAQQKGSKLRNSVRVESVNGTSAFFDRLGATAAVQRTTRHGDTPLIDTPHSRRRVSLTPLRVGGPDRPVRQGPYADRADLGPLRDERRERDGSDDGRRHHRRRLRYRLHGRRRLRHPGDHAPGRSRSHEPHAREVARREAGSRRGRCRRPRSVHRRLPEDDHLPPGHDRDQVRGLQLREGPGPWAS